MSTRSAHLGLVDTAAEHREPPPRRLVLDDPERAQEFFDAAAAAGLAAGEAARLAIERALVLNDARLFGLSRETARRKLQRAAAAARPRAALSDVDAAYVRRLTVGPAAASRSTPTATPTPAPRSVEVPERLLRRAGGSVSEAALHARAVDEMVGWEIAAQLEGRTMGEWALKTLAAPSPRSVA